MGRSKKNWDHLVDQEGNYYDLTNALGPKGNQGDKGDPGQKGDRGRIGRRGLKGEPGVDAPPLFIWKGRVPTEADLPQAVPGTNGWTYQAEDTKYFYVSNADGTYTEVQNLDLIKGDSGDDGATAYELALDNGFSGTEAEWLESLKGEQGDEGKVPTRLLRIMVSQEQKQSGLSLLKPKMVKMVTVHTRLLSKTVL